MVNMKEEIKLNLDVLVGSTFTVLEGAGGVAYFGFGEPLVETGIREYTSEKESTSAAYKKFRNKYNFFLYCAFHVRRHNKVLLGSGDFYVPNSEWKSANDREEFEYKNKNLLHSEFIHQYFRLLARIEREKPIIKRIDSDEIGGLKIVLSKGYIIEVFPNISNYKIYEDFEDYKDLANHEDFQDNMLWRLETCDEDPDGKPEQVFIVTPAGTYKTS